MKRRSFVVFVVVAIVGVAVSTGCGSVAVKADANGNGSGSRSGSGSGSGSGAACTSNDQCMGATPVCDVPDGFCVQCLQNAQCSGATPTCDTTMHSCRACALDADCDSNTCDAATGMCVAEANVLYVSPTGPDSGTCTMSAPCSIVQANAVADQTRNNIKLAPGSYSTHLVLTNKTLVFFGVGATIAGIGTNPVFEVDDGARLRINGASLTANTGSTAIRCEGSATASHTLELFRANVDNTSTTLLANPCTLTVEQSVLHNSSPTAYALLLVGPSVGTFNRTKFVGNGTGLAALNTPTVTITNSELKTMGSAANHGAFSGAGYNVSFSTLVDTMVECSSSGATGLTLDSSIVFWASGGAPVDSVAGLPSCTSVKNSVITPNSQPVGATNINMDPGLKNVGADDYHLLATSPAIDHGNPTSTNAIDFDGISRPQGAQRDSGAFEFKP